MIGGGHETPQSVRFFFNNINFDDVVAQCDANGGEIVIAVDMKMQGLICGLQNQSSINPVPYDLWSQRERHSEDDVSFTSIFCTVIKHLKIHLAFVTGWNVES